MVSAAVSKGVAQKASAAAAKKRSKNKKKKQDPVTAKEHEKFKEVCHRIWSFSIVRVVIVPVCVICVYAAPRNLPLRHPPCGDSAQTRGQEQRKTKCYLAVNAAAPSACVSAVTRTWHMTSSSICSSEALSARWLLSQDHT